MPECWDDSEIIFRVGVLVKESYLKSPFIIVSDRLCKPTRIWTFGVAEIGLGWVGEGYLRFANE